MWQVVLLHKIPLFVTLLAWGVVGYFMGLPGFFLVVVLSILEITLSADNAVVNSRVLVKMSPLWQKLFMTVGIFVAVFLIRFVLPIVLVAVASGSDSLAILNIALNHPEEYGEKLHDIAPIIDSFGGMFLFMVATFFFVDIARAHFWIKDIERYLAHFARIAFIKPLAVLVLLGTVILLLPAEERVVVGLAMFVAIVVYSALHATTHFMGRFAKASEHKAQVGWVALGSFMYLEVLDASFSLDGVVGAFALTNNIVIIMIGLGIGALWVRTLTLHMVQHKTLAKYEYLESGAHWAIMFLSGVMLLKLFHIELPEVVVGSIGLICIAASIYSSKKTIDKVRT